MKTTVEIADSLLAEARREASRARTTVRALIERGLRRVLDERKKSRPFRLRRVTFKGRGLQPPLADGDWEAIRQRAYEGRGA
jgi:hypothetical protein